MLAQDRLYATIGLTMPGILHYPTTHIIIQVGLKKPPLVPLIIAPWSLMNLPPCNPKLGTAGHCNDFRNLNTGEQLFEPVGKICTGVDSVIAVGVRHGMDLIRTAEHPGTAQIYIADRLEVRELESFDHRHSIIVRIVIVPLVAL